MTKYPNQDLAFLMQSRGIKTPAELGRLSGVGGALIGRYLYLKFLSIDQTIKSSATRTLAEFFNVPVDLLFPVDSFYPSIAGSEYVDSLSEYLDPISKEYEGLVSNEWCDDPYLALMESRKTPLEEVLKISQSGISTRFYNMFAARVLDERTYRDIGGEHNITVERVRQIILTCYRKLRHPSCSVLVVDSVGIAGINFNGSDTVKAKYSTPRMHVEPYVEPKPKPDPKPEPEPDEVRESITPVRFAPREIKKPRIKVSSPYVSDYNLMLALPPTGIFPYQSGYLLWNGEKWVNIDGLNMHFIECQSMPVSRPHKQIRQNTLISIPKLAAFQAEHCRLIRQNT